MISYGLTAQSPISLITYADPLPPAIPNTTLVTAPDDALNNIIPNYDYNVNYGTGDNLEIGSYTVNGRIYDNFVLPDTLIIRRTDNQPYINIWYTLSNLDNGSNPGELDVDANMVSDADALYQSGVLNAGYDNILVNDDDEGNSVIQAQVERIDVVWYSGLVTCQPDSAVFPIIERGGNDEIKIAAILSIDANGDPTSYGPMIAIEDEDWPDDNDEGNGSEGGRSFDNFLILRRQTTGVTPSPIINIGTLYDDGGGPQPAQSVQGVAVSFSELGVGASQVIYGFSLFAFDTNAISHTLTDISTFPTNTKASNSGLDLVAGLSAGVSADDCLTPSIGPGGYKSALAAWLKANKDISASTEGDPVTLWEDQWIYNHDASTSVGSPLYRSSTSNINFNPTVDFTSGSTTLTIANHDDFNTGGPYTHKGLNIAFRTSSSQINTRQVLYEQGGTTRGINVYIYDGQLHLSGWDRSSDGSGAPWNDGSTITTVSTAISQNTEYIVTLEQSGTALKAGTITGYLNGQSFGSISGVGLLYSGTDGIEFGGSDGTSQYENGTDASVNSYFGEISEFIYCNEPGGFPLIQRNRIESYLAIKYGITLNQSTPMNYVNADGSVIFNTTSDASIGGYLQYNKDIAGIGRDDKSVLEQPKSKSENDGSVVTVDHGGSFSSNNSWLIWGNDGGDLDDDETTDRPPLITRRVERVWRVAETGSTGGNTISFDISGMTFNGGTPTSSDFSLLVADNSSGGAFTSADIVSGGSLDGSGTILTFSDVDLSNGQYFTLGTGFISCAPGNVTTGLSLWLRADYGPNTSTNGSDVSIWGDFAGTNDAEGVSDIPNYVANAINYNPALNFDSSQPETLEGAAGFNTTAYYLVIKPAQEIFPASTGQVPVGFSNLPGSNNFGGLGLGNFTDDVSNELFTHSVGVSPKWRRIVTDGTTFGLTILAGSNLMVGVRNNATNNGTEISINGRRRDNNSSGSFLSSLNADYRLGDLVNPNDRSNAPLPFNGQIAEVISFSSRPDDTNQRKIQSYLAIKYGITLNQSTAQNYLNSAGSIIWNSTDNSSYANNIAGIGRDDGSCLGQKQSKSVNSGAIVAMGLGTIASRNKTNPNGFDTDQSFLIWGNNSSNPNHSAAVNSSNDVTPDLPSGVTERMRRVWRVDKTGTVENTTVSFDLSGLFYSTEESDFRLIISNTATMASGSTIAGGTFNGNVLTFNGVNFSDGDYFTLGTEVETCGPGGVVEANGLALWFKADKGPNTSTDNTAVSTWEDNGPFANDAFREVFAGPGTSEPKLRTSIFNFNPVVRFYDPGTENGIVYLETLDDPVSGDLTLTTVFSTTQTGGSTTNFELAPVLMSSGSYSSGQDYALGFTQGKVYFNAANNNSASAVRSTNTYFDGKQRIATGTRVQAASGAVNLYIDSKKVATGTSDATALNISGSIGLGNNSEPTVASQFAGDMAEAMAFSSVLSANERMRVESYLAIKYGITRAGESGEEDYLAADSGIIWDWSEATAYNYRIAGIGRDDSSCLLQEKSKSVKSGAIVTIKSASALGTDDSFMIWGSQNVDLEAKHNPEYDASVISSRLNREWYVQETGTVGAVDVTFDLSTVTGPTGIGTNNLNQVRLMVDDDGDFRTGTTYTSPTSIDASAKTVTFRVNLNDTQFFTLGSTEDAALPITLISFKAKNIENQMVQLEWVTATETGNSFYTIERSANGKDFKGIGAIEGAGNSESIINYEFKDLHPLLGTSYYRLKQTDFNGEYEYSAVERVVISTGEDAAPAFGVYPNPVISGQKFRLSYNVYEDQVVNVQIISPEGALLNSMSLDLKQGSEYVELNSSLLRKGINLIRVIDRERKITTIKVLYP